MREKTKPFRDAVNNDYLNFIKKNHLKLLLHEHNPQWGHHRSLSKGEDFQPEPKKAQAHIPLPQNKTITIQIEQRLNDQVFPLKFTGNNFSNYRSTKRRLNEVRLSNSTIQTIIQSKRQSVMKIVNDNVQNSINNKKVLIQAQNAILKGQKKSIGKLMNFQREYNDERESKQIKDDLLRLPQISSKKDIMISRPQNQVTSDLFIDQTASNCYNEYIRQKYLDVNMPDGFDRKLSQQIPIATRRKRTSLPARQRYEQTEKLIDTFYEYQKLMQIKELKIQQKRMKLLESINSSIKPPHNTANQNKPTSPQKSIPINNNQKAIETDQKPINSLELVSRRANAVDQHSQLTLEQASVKELQEQEMVDTQLPQNVDSPNKKLSRSVNKPKIYLNKDKQMTVYERKISTYRDFIFKVNFAHGRYDPLALKEQVNYFKNDFKYRAYIGRGNNSMLIRSLLKRRFWWTFDEQAKNSHFVWTQLKINSCFDRQNPSKVSYCIEPLIQESPRLSKKKKNQPQSNQQSKSKLKPDVPKGHDKIFIAKDQRMMDTFDKLQLQAYKLEDFDYRMKYLDKKLLPVENPSSYTVHNHLECNFHLGNKKAMFYNLRQYYDLIGKDVFNYLPLTFHIKKGFEDKQYKNFVKYFKKREQLVKAHDQEDDDLAHNKTKKKKKVRNIWIVKPGEISNRGNGITVIDQLYELNKILKSKEKHSNGNDKTYIVQAYLDRPFLYNRRKFDLRHYMLITTLYGRIRAYWYSEGYIRTSSCEFNLQDLGDPMVHLTNDAIQKYGDMYGKYEQGNKISYAEFQRYLDQQYPDKKLSFYDSIYPKMREIARDAVRSTYLRLDPRKLQHNFEIFGLDFMIDQEFNAWLIEINTNPCLQISSGLLGRIIPTMVEHAFRLSIDVLFPPMAQYPNTQKHLAPDNALDNMKFQLIFDEEVDAYELTNLYKSVNGLDCGQIDQQEQTYENDGKQYDQEII